jgi:cytoskeletal protein CcmA (bactofilin family)
MPIGPRGWRRVVPDAAQEAAQLAAGEPAAGIAAPAAAPGADASAADAAPPETARIEHGCEMSGTLALGRPLVIEGEFRGAIASESSVVVSESGSVEATIRARSVVIRGAVVGDVTASREVVIHAGARVHGDVETPSLVIERGAFFNGRTRMYRPEHALRAAPPAP